MGAQGIRSTYSLPGTTRCCAETGREIATGEVYVAALVLAGEPGNEEFRRMDYSLPAWTAGARPRHETGRRLPLLGSWRASMPAPDAKRRVLIDDEALLDLFEQSAEPAFEGAEGAAADPKLFRFMLALILIRKRLLVCERTDRSGVMHVRPRGSPKASEGGTLQRVEDPGVGEGAIATIVQQLSMVLEGAEPASTGIDGKAGAA